MDASIGVNLLKTIVKMQCRRRGYVLLLQMEQYDMNMNIKGIILARTVIGDFYFLIMLFHPPHTEDRLLLQLSSNVVVFLTFNSGRVWKE